MYLFVFFKSTAPTEIYPYRHTLALLDALPIWAHPLHHAPHPAGAFAARGALAAAFMLVEIADAADRLDDVGRLVHHDRGGAAEAGAEFLEPVEIHRRVHDLLRGNQRHRRYAGDPREQSVPDAAAAHGRWSGGERV